MKKIVILCGLFLHSLAYSVDQECINCNASEERIRLESYSKALLSFKDPVNLDTELRRISHRTITRYVSIAVNTKDGIIGAYHSIHTIGGKLYIMTSKDSSLGQAVGGAFSANLIQTLDRRYSSLVERYTGTLVQDQDPAQVKAVWNGFSKVIRYEASLPVNPINARNFQEASAHIGKMSKGDSYDKVPADVVLLELQPKWFRFGLWSVDLPGHVREVEFVKQADDTWKMRVVPPLQWGALEQRLGFIPEYH